MQPTVSIIIPVYNDKDYLLETIKRVEAALIPGFAKEIIIVDDCSTDGGQEILKNLPKKYKIIFHKKNQGVGGALRSGLKIATGDYIVRQDDDLEYDPKEISYLLHPLLTNQADIVYGSRTLNRNNKYSKKTYYLGGRFISLVFNLLYLNTISDFITASKAFKTKVIKDLCLESNGFEIESEISAKAIKKGFRIVSLPISYRPRTFEQGKKIRWHHALTIIITLLKYRFM